MAYILSSGQRGKRGKEFAFRGDSTGRSFLAMTAMIDKRQRERRETRFRLKGPQKRSTVVRYRWAISGRNARRRSVEGLSKPRLTRRRIQRPRMIYRSEVGIIPLLSSPSLAVSSRPTSRPLSPFPPVYIHGSCLPIGEYIYLCASYLRPRILTL